MTKTAAKRTLALAFRFARHLRDATLRARLSRLGAEVGTSTVVCAVADETVGALLARVHAAGGERAFVVVPDRSAGWGVALYLVTTETRTPL
jgi:hypothetical protein